MSRPPFPMQLPCLPSSFPACRVFPLFILPACAFISVYATHIVSLPLSCSHYFHSTACTYKPLLSLINPFRFPAPFLLFFPAGFVVSINIFLWLVHCTPLFFFLPCFLSQFWFYIFIFHAPLFALFIFLLLSCFVRFIITCTTFLPFPCFIYFYPTVQCRFTHADFALSVPLLSILALPYTFWCLSCFILSPIFSLSCLPFSSFSFLLLCFSCFLHLLVFLGTDLPNENKNRQDCKVSGEVPSPFYPFHCFEKINTWVGHYQRLLGTLLAT